MWAAHRPCTAPPCCLFRLLLPAAAIARRVYIRQGMGVGGFRRAFGGRSNAAGLSAPEHHAKAAGGIIRHALQQLEAMGLVEKNPAAQGGRRITAEGQRQVSTAGAAAAAPHGCYPLRAAEAAAAGAAYRQRKQRYAAGSSAEERPLTQQAEQRQQAALGRTCHVLEAAGGMQQN